MIHFVHPAFALSDVTFKSPSGEYSPETWFHLIGGNVSKTGLTADLEAVTGAGLQGIQLFHGRGGEWPGVELQIQSLSPAWEDMIAHVGEETDRLGLKFTMQNCPGWAMSGGPWITPDRAMRHLIWSRTDVLDGEPVISLPRPQPSMEEWRDYRDVAVLAFPAPDGDSGECLQPDSVRSNKADLPWEKLLAGESNTSVRLDPSPEPAWVEVTFNSPVNLRSICLPPVEHLMLRRSFDPDTTILVEAITESGRREVGRRKIPRGTWQDRQEGMDVVLSYADCPANTFRITFLNRHSIELRYLKLSSAARINDWRGQAGYALRSLERSTVPLQDKTAWISPDSIIDLSDKMDTNGRLDWQVPPGKWTVVRFGHVNTGVKNKPAPPEATGFECDKLSPLGAEQHFAGYIGRVTRPGGPVDGGRLDGMLIDSWECYTQTWTPDMEAEFRERRGYTLREWLPAIAGWVVADHTTSERFLRDWRKTISDLLVENYFGRLAELGRERGLKLSFETALGDVSPGDILQYFGKADIPMCEFWHPNDPHWGGFETKPIHPTVSAAHIYGKPIVAAEAFTNIGIRWDEHPFMLKHQADRHFALGVNHLIFHTYTHNPRTDLVPGTSFGSQIGTPFLRGQTWWKHMPLFTDYLSRCHYMLQQGKPVADVLWYLGDDFDHKPRQDSPFPDGYDFDYLNADVLLNRITVVDGLLHTPEGNEWKVLWIPQEQCRRLTPETLTRIRELLQAGATVIGPAPIMNATLSGGAAASQLFDSLVGDLWGAPADRGDRKIGKGRLIWGDALEDVLCRLGIQPDLAGTRSASWGHRRDGDRDIYFLAADRISPLRANLLFRATGQPEFWNPVTGQCEPAPVFHSEGAHTRIPIELDAGGSLFVVFDPGSVEPAFVSIEHQGRILLDARDASFIDTAPSYPKYGLTPGEQTQPIVDTLPLQCRLLAGGKRLLAWEAGRYKLTRSGGETIEFDVAGAGSRALDGEWTLSFPKGWDTPEQVSLDAPLPWSSLDDLAIRAFSGTAIYRTVFLLEDTIPDSRLMLDLGNVSNIAEILVNGRSVAKLWTPPFRVDVTGQLKPGRNEIAIHVTNTWHNRLAYDAALPEADRKTWTIHGPDAGAPAVPAGLDGQVRLWTGIVKSLKDF